MKFDNATKFHRKSGGAQWRDLRFLFWFSRELSSPYPSDLLNDDLCEGQIQSAALKVG
jgi:hypothetical protein